MATLREVLSQITRLPAADVEWLQQLIGDWQLISDLSFADLVLWVSATDGELAGHWVAAAHVRPTTGQMVFYEDVVGHSSGPYATELIQEGARTRHVARARATTYRGDTPVREEAVPVVRHGRVLAVLTRHTNLVGRRTPSRLELTYNQLADDLCRMVARGDFPQSGSPTGQRRGAPRVGDGVMHLDVDGNVRYASPNAISALHRLGHHGPVIGELLPKVVADLMGRESHVDESLAVVVTGRAPWRSEVSSGGAAMSIRAIPLTEEGARSGALLLVREISELRRRERELITKDATIREIHHRVKNNLQTVAALLRLQARRLEDSEARDALEQAVRRVGVIAMVHETLGQGFQEAVEFDEIAALGLQAVIEVAATDQHIESSLRGSFGRLRAEDATAMAMILSELIQNAVEHGLAATGGSIEVEVEQTGADGERGLAVTVTDDGSGLPADFRPGRSGLGTQIVRSLVSDLRGTIEWERVEPHGTRVRLTARLRPLAD